MKILNQNELNLFSSIVKMSQKELFISMKKYLKNLYKDNIIIGDKYLYAIGETPVALIAHLDTVFKTPPKNIYYDKEENVLWSPQGLGADDRAGVYAIIKILQKGYRPSVIFTTDEEIGGLGAEKLIKDYPNPTSKLKYVIELDRQGHNDCVFYNCDNIDFTNYVESFGFKENFGSFSDISVICPKWEIAGVNLSIGYYDEHSIAETLHINDFFLTLNKVCKMLKDSKKSLYYKYIPNLLYDFDYLMSNMPCFNCHNLFNEYELFPVLTSKRIYKLYCPDCLVDLVKWCSECGKPFEIDKENPSSSICYNCRAASERKEN